MQFAPAKVSEAQAESVNSLIKKYGSIPNLSFSRIREKVILRSGGISGDGADDRFILRTWAAFFGESSTFKFHAQKLRRRKRLFPLGRGSKTIHTLLKRSLQSSQIPHRIGKLSVQPGAHRPTGTQWAKALRKN
jgi:hypothetical protein